MGLAGPMTWFWTFFWFTRFDLVWSRVHWLTLDWPFLTWDCFDLDLLDWNWELSIWTAGSGTLRFPNYQKCHTRTHRFICVLWTTIKHYPCQFAKWSWMYLPFLWNMLTLSCDLTQDKLKLTCLDLGIDLGLTYGLRWDLPFLTLERVGLHLFVLNLDLIRDLPVLRQGCWTLFWSFL